MKKTKQILSAFLAVGMCTLAMPMGIFAAEATHDVSLGNIVIGNTCGTSCSGHTITGTSTAYTVSVTGGTHNITIKDLNIENDSSVPFDIQTGATVNLALEGANTLKSTNKNYAALHVPAGATLTVAKASTGSLEAIIYVGYGNGAGIGGNKEESGGTITINGGNVTATGIDGPGIGGGAKDSQTDMSNTGDITISGGKVKASSSSGAGIGGGKYCNGGNITITGGIVEAEAIFGGAGIGGGISGAGGTITINGGNVTATGIDGPGIGNGKDSTGNTAFTANGNAVIFAQNKTSVGMPISVGSGEPDRSAWKGVIFECIPNKNEGKVYGNVKPTENFTIPVTYKLTIPKDATLDIDGITVTNEGTINTHCKDENEYKGTGTVKRPHGVLDYTAKVDATCTADGNEEYWTCPDCDKIFRNDAATTEFDEIPTIEKLGHDFENAPWVFDAKEHWHVCQRTGCGEIVSKASHIEDNGTVTKEPTETEDGERTYACTVCSKVLRTEKIDKLPPEHVCDFGTEWKHNATEHWKECDCGKKDKVASHTEDKGAVTKEPTIDSEGEKTFKCTVCGRILRTEAIDKLPSETTVTTPEVTDASEPEETTTNETTLPEPEESSVNIGTGGFVTYIITPAGTSETEDVTLGAGVEEEKASDNAWIVFAAALAVLACAGLKAAKKKA